MDGHLEGLREIERGLDPGSPDDDGGPNATCTAPTHLHPRLKIGAPVYEETSYAFLDIIAHALACDLTRVVVMEQGSWSPRHLNDFFNSSDFGDYNHHEMSHDSSQTAQSRQADVDSWTASALHRLASKMEVTQEGGGSVLDNSVIVWGRESRECRESTRATKCPIR